MTIEEMKEKYFVLSYLVDKFNPDDYGHREVSYGVYYILQGELKDVRERIMELMDDL